MIERPEPTPTLSANRRVISFRSARSAPRAGRPAAGLGMAEQLWSQWVGPRGSRGGRVGRGSWTGRVEAVVYGSTSGQTAGRERPEAVDRRC